MADLRPGREGSDPSDLVVRAGRVWFAASDGRTRRVWSTDGTAAGTAPSPLFPPLAALSTVWLGAVPGALAVTTSEPTASVWLSDGASPAVNVLAHGCDGPCGVGLVQPAGGRLLVSIFYKRHPTELWVAGPGAGAAQLLEGNVRRIVGAGPFGVLYVPDAGGLWLADGTTARAIPTAADLRNGPANDAAAVGGALLFAAAGQGGAASELWRSDGTAAGTARVKDLGGPEAFLELRGFTAAGGKAFFLRDTGGEAALWVTDGTEPGTRALASGLVETWRLAPAGAGVVFQARQGSGPYTLWTSDGTPDGTRPLAALAAPIEALTTVASGEAWLGADAGDGSGLEPWHSDGTASGTGPAANVAPDTRGAEPADLTPFGGGLLFTADDGAHGPEPWRTDGTAAGTALLADLWPGPPGGAPRGYAVGGSRAWFFDLADPSQAAAGVPPPSDVRLWSTDGTTPGTTLRRDRFLTAGCTDAPCPRGPLVAGGRALYLVTDEHTFATQLWADDGATATPVSGPSPSVIAWPVALGGRVIFVDVDHLAATDGVTVAPVPGPARVSALAAAGDAALAVGEAAPGVTGLYRVDGVSAPVLLRQLPDPSRGTLTVTALASAAGKAWFAVESDATGPEPWVSDGTPAGTGPLGDLLPGPEGSTPSGFAAAGGGVVFFADDGVHGREPWISDGSPAGTRLLLDLHPGPAGSAGADAHAVALDASRFAFAASDGASGDELWVSDGTAPGTRLVMDLAPGQRSSSPADLAVIGGRLLATAEVDGGRQLVAADLTRLLAAAPQGEPGPGPPPSGSSGCGGAAAWPALWVLLAVVAWRVVSGRAARTPGSRAAPRGRRPRAPAS